MKTTIVKEYDTNGNLVRETTEIIEHDSSNNAENAPPKVILCPVYPQFPSQIHVTSSGMYGTGNPHGYNWGGTTGTCR